MVNKIKSIDLLVHSKSTMFLLKERQVKLGLSKKTLSTIYNNHWEAQQIYGSLNHHR